MTHFSDGVRVGALFPTQPTNTAEPHNRPQNGAPMSPVFVYSVVPLATSVTGLGTGGTYSGAPLAVSFSAGSGVSATTSINNVTYYDLGCARGVTFSGAVSTVTGCTITLSGLDCYLQPLTVTMSGPTGTALVTTPKTLQYLFPTFTVSGNTTSVITPGVGDRLGFPYRVDAFDYVDITMSNTKITANTGFQAASTTTATAATGDVRGYYDLQTAANGTRRFTAWIYVADPDTQSGLYGVTQA